ncbi:hypothetical protein [Pseudodesulfovibrio sp. S3]|uniref:hypothetical protein n=2 Tax=unclassified Pseudodesulfovibrio TaxID=2661612 RepID=UPI0013E32316|nr:hypothetical protein [Pseudodesulfovibrio sp. S3]MCJ2165530.1 hypothetical protein [Pseudodesulfovibrio sp. S3-i]
MEQTHPSTPTASRLAAVPLAVAYLAVPLGTVLIRHMPPTDGSPFLPWVILAALGAVHAILFRRSGARLKKRFFFEVAMFMGLVSILFLRQKELLRQLETFASMAPELTPVVMLGFCWLWAVTFGLPDRAAFQRYGAALGVLCILDLVVEILVHQAVPAMRWIGDSNVLAGLLLVALCAGLRPGKADGGLFEPDQGLPIWRTLILAGIMACLSRTGLFAAGWIFLCFGRGSRVVRMCVCLICFLLIGVTFLLPATPSDLSRFVDYWLWAKSLNMFSLDPSLLIFGLPLDRALPMTFPPEMTSIWEAVTGAPALFGVHLQQIPSFWLRLLLGWGLIVPLLFLSGLLILLLRRPTRMGAGLAAAIFAQGMSTPLLYCPALGAAMGLALFLALSASAATPLPNKKQESAPQRPEPPSRPDTDPAAQWDLRPL